AVSFPQRFAQLALELPREGVQLLRTVEGDAGASPLLLHDDRLVLRLTRHDCPPRLVPGVRFIPLVIAPRGRVVPPAGGRTRPSPWLRRAVRRGWKCRARSSRTVLGSRRAGANRARRRCCSPSWRSPAP